MSGPLQRVLSAFDDGYESLAAIAAATGLDRSVVEAAVDHLVRTGRVQAQQLSVGCPSGGCGSCASGSTSGGAGCGASGPSRGRSGPVLVALQRAPTPPTHSDSPT